jgi:hypothetical protein
MEFSTKYYRQYNRIVFVTPKDFLDTTSLFFSLLSKQKTKMYNRHRRFATGVDILNCTNDLVL